MVTYQLDFFKTDEECEMEALRTSVNQVKLSTDKVRKSLFAKHGELEKKYLDLHDRFLILERNLCQGV